MQRIRVGGVASRQNTNPDLSAAGNGTLLPDCQKLQPRGETWRQHRQERCRRQVAAWRARSTSFSSWHMIYASNTRFYSRAAPPAPRTPNLGRVMAADVHFAAGTRLNGTAEGCKTLAARSFGQPGVGSPLQQKRGGVGCRTCPRRSTGLSPTRRYAERCKPKRCRELERPLQFLASSEKGLRLPRGNTRGVIPALQTASHTQRGLSQPINWSTAVQGPPEKPSPSPRAPRCCSNGGQPSHVPPGRGHFQICPHTVGQRAKPSGVAGWLFVLL